jgi:NAD+ synthase (glutamine-hydrolysing)
MRVGLAQINSTLGDFAKNRESILSSFERAIDKHCDLVVFPELALMGYLPNDLLERDSVVEQQLKEFQILEKQFQKLAPAGVAALVGLITRSSRRNGRPYLNSAALLQKGKKTKFFHKELLPTYDVFDEARHLEKGATRDGFFTFKKQRILVTICEDIWGWPIGQHPSLYLHNPLKEIRSTKSKINRVDLVLNLSASPFTLSKADERRAVVGKTARHFKAPMVYVNLVGGQDEIIFDGGSFATDARGRVIAQSMHFEEDLNVIDFTSQRGGSREAPPQSIESVRRALVLGIRDYTRKCGVSSVHLGLSGGVDSAVVACLAVDALGPRRVLGAAMPGPFNDPLSLKLAEGLARNLGIELLNFAIEPAYDTVLSQLQSGLGSLEFGLVQENVQARLRGLLMMAVSNHRSSMLLTTGNKSELATGYSTLYGDMCGGLAPIGDLLKGQVYQLARHYNSERELIPAEIITRAPSAELRPGQKDQDSLPPYDELDEAVRNLVELKLPARTATEKWLLQALMKSEFKRWQAPPILKISTHGFGRGRRFPIAHRAGW